MKARLPQVNADQHVMASCFHHNIPRPPGGTINRTRATFNLKEPLTRDSETFLLVS